MYIVVFFLLLWTLFQVILCEVTIPHFHLLESNEKIHRDKNKQFITQFNNLKNYLDINGYITVLNVTSDDLIEIMEASKNLKYVIDLHVQDTKNYDKIDKTAFDWVGDIEDSVCKIDFNDTLERELTDCKLHKEPRQQVKMVSKAVQDIQSLFKFIRDFKLAPDKRTRHTVLVCTNELREFEEHFLVNDDIISFIKSKCKHQYGTIPALSPHAIAVIAPNPEWIEETNKPVIFYDEFYVNPEGQEFYGNSMKRVRKWKQMTDTFLRYMRTRNWNRMAILSDDALESEGFEAELRSLFNAYSVSYTVRSVIETNGVKCCDFSEALASLKQSEPRIIIANVAENNAEKLAQQAKRLGLTFNHDIVWLARGWSQATAKVAANSLDAVFSVTPQPTPIEEHIASIKIVIESYKEFNHFYNEKKFAQDIEKHLRWSNEAIYYVTQTKYNGDHTVVATYVNGKTTFYSNIYAPKDRKEQCTLRTDNYDKPCEDMDLILFMLVLCGFSVMLLAITFYYQIPYTPRFHTRYSRMAS